MCIQLWQLDTIAVDDKEKAIIALCEEQESIIEDLRYEVKEAEDDRDSYKWDADDNYRQLNEMEKKRDDLQDKLDSVQKMLEEVDEMGCGLEYINEILNLLE